MKVIDLRTGYIDGSYKSSKQTIKPNISAEPAMTDEYNNLLTIDKKRQILVLTKIFLPACTYRLKQIFLLFVLPRYVTPLPSIVKCEGRSLPPCGGR